MRLRMAGIVTVSPSNDRSTRRVCGNGGAVLPLFLGIGEGDRSS